ncbi:RIMS-binding protein 2 isoform X3 [Octopus vulgaris]|uniref:RIMS-binding protein 2 isoform X3 n=1 Tax=Octopus vulgaris TaxID=6645 RepID=A0AA36BUS4_OCTVU|nr:RIMS-binding protein 2 isoform X3 [Octopus vulgaris]
MNENDEGNCAPVVRVQATMSVHSLSPVPRSRLSPNMSVCPNSRLADLDLNEGHRHILTSSFSLESKQYLGKEILPQMCNTIRKLQRSIDSERKRNQRLRLAQSKELHMKRQTWEKEKWQCLHDLEGMLLESQQLELNQVIERLRKEKDNELNEILKYKDEEVKQLKKLFVLEKEDSIRIALELEKSEIFDTVYKQDIECLKKEIKFLQSQIKSLGDQYYNKCLENDEYQQQLNNIKERIQTEFLDIFQSSNKLVSLRYLEKLKSLEKLIFGDKSNSFLLEHSFGSYSNCFGNLSVGETPRTCGTMNKRLFEEKEKPLQKKVGELQSQVLKLERKTMLLKNENESLKRKQEDYKSREEKLKSFRKRNAELAAVARRLEDKAKILQQQNLKKSGESHDTESVRKQFQKQRAREHAEYSKSLLAKEKEIEELKRQYQILAEKISSMSKQLPQNSRLYEDQEELEAIIKQAAKERLHLEKQLVRTKMSVSSQVNSRDISQENGKTNISLDIQKEKLQQSFKQLAELEQNNKELQSEISLLKDSSKTKQLESELLDTTLKNNQLEENVERLEMKLQESESVSEECTTLKLSLKQQEQECEIAKEKIASLEAKISSLQQIIKDLQKSDEQLKILDAEHKQTLQRLSMKNEEIQKMDEAKNVIEHQHNDTIETLKSQLGQLEHKYRMQELKQEELNIELTMLRDQRQAAINAPKSDKSSLSQESILVEPPDQRTPHNMSKPPGRLLADSRLPAMVGSGQVQVYIAKYNYDPFQFSPNENPETELALNSGDYVFINGEMDEDGFFEGELINGSKGLVPSNFVEKVPDVDLIDFSSILVASGHHSDESVLSGLSTQPDLDFNSSDESEKLSAIMKPPVLFPDDKVPFSNLDSLIDLGDIEEVDEDSHSKLLGLTDYSNFDKGTVTIFPHKLNLDRQLTNSVLISWVAPEVDRNVEIICYQVFVDNKFKISVKRNERTKALLEDIDSKKTCRVCVLCLTTLGRSAPQQCTMLVGKDVIPVPSDLKVSHISANGAVLSWLPGNSNYQHVICVNEQEVRVVNPGVYEYILTGLTPATSHTVSVRAKSLLSNFEEERSDERKEQLTERIEFKTLAGGLPDPPLDVQVEVGPQEGTVLLTWLPVTINASGISPSGIIKGYVIYADGKKLKEVNGPINDHILLTSNDCCGRMPDRLTVRTLADNNEESVDSQGVILPPNLLKEMAAKTAKNIAYEAVAARKVPPDRSAFHSPVRRPSSKASDRRSSQHGMTIPAIEITRDSSTERGNSFEDEEEPNLQKRKSIEDKTKGFSRKKIDEVDCSFTSPNNSSIPKQKDNPIEKCSANSSQRWRTEIIPDRILGSPNSVKVRPSSSCQDSDIYYEDNSNVRRGIDSSMRLFVALFDYDPAVMSPNADGSDAELPFQEGDFIKIFGDCGADGFYRGEANGKLGYVPGNMVTEVKVRDPDVVQQLLKDNTSTSSGESSSTPGESKENFLSKSLYRSADLTNSGLGPGKLMVALYDYDPRELSPNVDAEVELAFKVGDFITIYGDMDDDGFFIGEMKGRKGLVPSNFIRAATMSTEELHRDIDVRDEARDDSHRKSKLSLKIEPELNRIPGMGSKSLSECKLDGGVRPASAPHSDEDRKTKRKGGLSSAHSMSSMGAGLLSKGKNIFKKFTR